MKSQIIIAFFVTASFAGFAQNSGANSVRITSNPSPIGFNSVRITGDPAPVGANSVRITDNEIIAATHIDAEDNLRVFHTFAGANAVITLTNYFSKREVRRVAVPYGATETNINVTGVPDGVYEVKYFNNDRLGRVLVTIINKIN